MLEKRDRGHIQGLPEVFEYPLLSQERVKYELQTWLVCSQGPCDQKPGKNLGENGAWAYPETVQIFRVTPIIPGTGKATNFKFCTHILTIDRNKSITNFFKNSRVRSEDSQKFSRHPYIGHITRSSLRPFGRSFYLRNG